MTKNYFLGKLLWLGGGILVFANAYGNVKTEEGSQRLAPKPLALQITSLGQNRQPLVVDKNKIVYVSRGRKAHKDPQIYIFDLATKKETRVTFQKGHITNGMWLNGSKKLVYASSTDEEKETPELLKKYLPRFPASIDTEFFFHLAIKPTEVYMSDLHGRRIERISNSMGFDAFPAFSKKENELYFSRLNKNRVGLFKKSLRRTSEPARLVLQTQGHDLGLQISPSQKKGVWYRFSPDFSSSQLMVSDLNFKDVSFLTMDDGIQWSPSWHPSAPTVIYSAKRKGDKNYQLYEVSLEEGCQRQITQMAGDEFYPVIGAQGEKIYFTSTKSGSEQIHQLKYPKPFVCQTY